MVVAGAAVVLEVDGAGLAVWWLPELEQPAAKSTPAMTIAILAPGEVTNGDPTRA